MKIKEIMTEKVDAISPEATLQEAAKHMKALNVGALPVVENDKLVGIITDRDVVVRAVAEDRNPAATKVSYAMNAPTYYALEDQDVAEAVKTMEEKQIYRLPILNHNKKLVGIVALADIAADKRYAKIAGHALDRIAEAGEAEAPRSSLA